MSEPLLAIQSLRVTGPTAPILDQVSLAVEPGELVGLLGANGAGKSSLLRAIMGLAPTRGSIRFAGEEIGSLGAAARARRGIGYVPEGRRLFPGMSVRDNLLVACREAPSREQRLVETLVLFPALRERLTTPAWQLSGGQQQMLAVARALMAAPRLLLLDEPSLGLAPLVVKQIFEVIADLNQREGLTVFLVEQNAFHALRLAHRGYVMVNGAITMQGGGAELLARPEVRAAYLEGGH
jgi:branched-chain amino acid transport system ATP-binding protein